jgi:hypothetical protein
MRLNEKEKRMFTALRKSDLGQELVGYIERLEGEICDVRNWTERDSIESARQASKHLKEMRQHLIVSGGSPQEPNQYI